MDSFEIIEQTPEELMESKRLLLRQLNRVHRMYLIFYRADEETISFSDYAYLFHRIPADIAAKWLNSGDV